MFLLSSINLETLSSFLNREYFFETIILTLRHKMPIGHNYGLKLQKILQLGRQVSPVVDFSNWLHAFLRDIYEAFFEERASEDKWACRQRRIFRAIPSCETEGKESMCKRIPIWQLVWKGARVGLLDVMQEMAVVIYERILIIMQWICV